MADTVQVLKLAAIIREVDGDHSKGAAALAELILDHPNFYECHQPAPPADGEMAELVAALQSQAIRCTCDQLTSGDLRRAAELLQRQALVPVAVSERLPGPEDCDAEGRCWFLRFPFDYSRESWSLEDRTYGCNTGFTHWLPAHALPLPEGGE